MTRTLAVAFSLAAILVQPGLTQADGVVRIFAETQRTISVDNGRAGTSAGDQRISGLVLLDRRGDVIGNGYRVCTSLDRVLGASVSLCSVIITLPLGKIVALGTRQRRDYYVLPVVGGTRRYSGTSGTLIASTVSLGPPRRERLLVSLTS